MKKKIDDLKFQPWISAAYRNNTGIYGKLLIIGESHYFEDKITTDINDSENSLTNDSNSEFTASIIQDYIDKKCDINFYRNLGLLFNKNDRYEVWNNVAFANGIQVGLESSESQPTQQEIATIIPTFWALLENLRPEKIIICSQRMWQNWMPDNDLRCKGIGDINSNDKHSTIWEYNYSNGKCLAIGINHPSSFFSYESWSPLVKKFISPIPITTQ